MLLAHLVTVSNSVAAVSSRLDKTRQLATFLQSVPPDEIEIAVAFLSGTPAQGRIGLGGAVISQAVRAAPPPATAPVLQLSDVHDGLGTIARTEGAGSSRARVSQLASLLGRTTTEERDFLIRLLFGELRQGALEGVLGDAIARASATPVATIRQAAMTSGSLTTVARVALTEGADALSSFVIQVFRAVQPMLAESAATVEEAMTDLGQAMLEFKLDGARIQVHKQGGDIRVFSRNLRDVTAAVPEVVEATAVLSANELIVDGEVLALDRDNRPLPFQETMRRFGRKLDIERLRSELPLTPFFFDCLYLDGESLLDMPLTERRTKLETVAARMVVPHLVTAVPSEAEAFMNESVSRGHEGIMAKALDGTYVAGSRGRSWLKVKVVRTLDLVVLAAEWGHGRRKGQLSNLHLGARDPESNGFVMLGKTFKGLTDEMLEWQTRALQDLETHRDDYTVYVRPELVVEVAFNDVQESPQYPGGLALRFARVKGYRQDKSASEADTIQTLRGIYDSSRSVRSDRSVNVRYRIER
ncbi:MAG TPA: ATP-dependent DNA ligase [Vicinamibacterales bacterium]